MTTVIHTEDFWSARAKDRAAHRALEAEAIRSLRSRGLAIEPHAVAMEREAIWIRNLNERRSA